MQLACWNFHTLEKPETKRERERERSLQDFGGFEQRGGGTKGKQEGADNVSRASCALCRLFCPFLILFPTRHTSADSAEKRSWRDPEGIPAVESMDAKDSLPDTHTLSLPLSLSLSLCAVSFFVVIARSSPLSLTISRVPHSSSSLGCCSLFFSHLT